MRTAHRVTYCFTVRRSPTPSHRPIALHHGVDLDGTVRNMVHHVNGDDFSGAGEVEFDGSVMELLCRAIIQYELVLDLVAVLIEDSACSNVHLRDTVSSMKCQDRRVRGRVDLLAGSFGEKAESLRDVSGLIRHVRSAATEVRRKRTNGGAVAIRPSGRDTRTAHERTGEEQETGDMSDRSSNHSPNPLSTRTVIAGHSGFIWTLTPYRSLKQIASIGI